MGTGAPVDLRIEEMPAREASRAVVVVLALRAVGAVSGLIVAGLLSRQLGPSGFGELSLIFAVAVIASSLSEVGTTQVAVTEMSARPERRREIAAGLAVLRALSGVVLAAAGAAVLVFLLRSPTAEWAALAVMATVPLAGVTALVVLAQARLRPQVGAALSLGQSVMWLGAVCVAGVFSAPLAAYGVAFLACGSVQAVGAWVLVVRRESPAWSRWRPALGWMLARSWPLAVAVVLGTVYYRLDGILLFQLRGSAEAGIYSAAYRFLDVFQLAPMALFSVLVPVLARQWSLENRAGFDRVLQLGLTVSMAVAVPVAVGGLVAGDRVATAAFGQRFAASGPVLSVLGLAFLGIATGYVYSAGLLADGRVKVIGAVAAGALVATVAADLVAIPRWGVMGAAWVTVGVEYLVTAAMALGIHRRHRRSFPWHRVRGALAAGLLMAAVGWALRDATLSILVVGCAATYGVAAVVFQAVTGADLRALRDRQLTLGSS